MEKKNNNNRGIFAVIGCTGHQGTGVIDAVARDGNRWKMRGLTRDPTTQHSMMIKQKGVELIEGDVLNRSDVKRFLTGVEALFVLTNYFDETIRHKEAEVGKQICDVAKECGVKYVILSTLPNVEKLSNRKYDVPHFTLKAQIEEHARKIGLRFVSVMPAFYYQNFLRLLAPKRENGTMVFTLPLPENTYMTMVDHRDIGTAVVNILKSFDQYEGRTIPLVGEHMPVQDIPRCVQEITGKPTKYKVVSFDEFETMKGRELTQMLGWAKDFGFMGPNPDFTTGKKLCTFTTFKDWLRNERPFDEFEMKQPGTTTTKQFGQQQQPGQTTTVRQG